jgi:hypothetical protein
MQNMRPEMGFIKHQPYCEKLLFRNVALSPGLIALLFENSDTVSTDEEEIFHVVVRACMRVNGEFERQICKARLGQDRQPAIDV